MQDDSNRATHEKSASRRLNPVHILSLVLIAWVLISVAGIVLLLTSPGTLQISDQVGDATVNFTVSRAWVSDKAECVLASWQVEGIQGVYINDHGTTGNDSRQICLAQDGQPALRVVFPDDTENTYTLAVRVIWSTPEIWAVLATIPLAIFFVIYLQVGLRFQQSSSLRDVMRRVAQGAVIVIITVGLTLVLIEVAMRFYFNSFGTEDDKVAYLYSAEEIQSQFTQFSPIPYGGYVPHPDYEGHNNLGYRGEDFLLKKPEGTYRIVTLGASTTYGFGVPANKAYPVILGETLREDYGYDNVEVINAGVIGYTSWEILTNFEFRVLDLEPDMIIYYSALNDTDARLENTGCFNAESPLHGITTLRGLWRTDFDTLPSSTLYRYFAINFDLMGRPGTLDFALSQVPLEKQCNDPTEHTPEELLALNSLQFTERNIRNLLILAQAYDIEVMISSFVHPRTQDQTESELLEPYRQQGIAELNDLLAQLADEFDVAFYDLWQDYEIVPGMFWSQVHMRPDGTKQQADLYAKFIAENELITEQPR